MSDNDVDDRCPWCGYRDPDLWDFEWGNREEVRAECGSCGRDIVISRHVDVSYVVSRPSEGDRRR